MKETKNKGDGHVFWTENETMKNKLISERNDKKESGEMETKIYIQIKSRNGKRANKLNNEKR